MESESDGGDDCSISDDIASFFMLTRAESGKYGNSNPNEEHLDFDNNYDYDAEMGRDIQSRNILHWNYRNLREIPKEVLIAGEHIEEIYLKRNCLLKLPKEIGRLKNLTNLYLIGNELATLPPEIGQLRRLKVLDLSQNLLEELPPSLGDLDELQDLLITQNQITNLPPELRGLRSLKYLELSGNNITAIDEDLVSNWTSLEDLGIDQNPLRILPRALSHLRHLRYLSVCHSKLTFLPALPMYKFDRVNKRELLEINQPVPTNQVDRSTSQGTELLQFRFDGNPHLHYIPGWIPQFYGLEMEYYGCGIHDESGHLTEIRNGFSASLPFPNAIQLNVVGFPRLLHFDPEIQKLHRPDVKKPCSLLESSIRLIYKTTKTSSSDSLQLCLPKNLAYLIKNGPTAQCFECQEFLYTEVWSIVFYIRKDGVGVKDKRLNLSTILFCGSSCVERFRTKSQSNEVNFRNSVCQREIVW